MRRGQIVACKRFGDNQPSVWCSNQKELGFRLKRAAERILPLDSKILAFVIVKHKHAIICRSKKIDQAAVFRLLKSPRFSEYEPLLKHDSIRQVKAS
jgi:hypothetical protein